MDVQYNKTEDMEVHEKEAFQQLIRPDDSFTAEGTYWADLPIGKRISWCLNQEVTELGRELSWLGNMFKNDPLSPIGYYFKHFVLPGAGLGLEGYVLFSISNVESLFGMSASFANCWDDDGSSPALCNPNWVAAASYLEIVGILLGQIAVGYLGDMIGRRFGLIQDAVIMTLGLVMLTAAWGLTLNGWVICYAISLLIYSFGVGGEYPMTATIGMEKGYSTGKIITSEDRLHRGRSVVGAFLMQGWGQLLNQVILILLLLIFNHGNGDASTISDTTTQWTYRVSFAIPAVLTLWLVYYRTYHMHAASKQLDAQKKKASVTGYDMQSLKLTFQYFGPRVLATAGGWFANDVFFYGNKLYSSNFIGVIYPNASGTMITWLYNLANIAVEMGGYYMAMWFVDNKLYGRKWMQIIGFVACFICFVIPAFSYNYYIMPENIHKFQAMYFLSTFFNQFGPNCITFLVAAEVFPAPIRGTAHGISAAAGKLGALVISIVGAYTGTQMQFLIVPWFGLAGAILTLLFLPDTTGLDLREQERRWVYIREGREAEYHGTAVHPTHLSMWENWMGAGKHYDPEQDYQQKIQEFRAEWETALASTADEKEVIDADEVDDAILNGVVHRYFERTNSKETAVVAETGAPEQQVLEKN